MLLYGRWKINIKYIIAGCILVALCAAGFLILGLITWEFSILFMMTFLGVNIGYRIIYRNYQPFHRDNFSAICHLILMAVLLLTLGLVKPFKDYLVFLLGNQGIYTVISILLYAILFLYIFLWGTGVIIRKINSVS